MTESKVGLVILRSINRKGTLEKKHKRSENGSLKEKDSLLVKDG